MLIGWDSDKQRTVLASDDGELDGGSRTTTLTKQNVRVVAPGVSVPPKSVQIHTFKLKLTKVSNLPQITPVQTKYANPTHFP